MDFRGIDRVCFIKEASGLGLCANSLDRPTNEDSVDPQILEQLNVVSELRQTTIVYHVGIAVLATLVPLVAIGLVDDALNQELKGISI